MNGTRYADKMRQLLFGVYCLGTMMIGSPSAAQTFYGEYQTGWFWYEPIPKVLPTKPQNRPLSTDPTERMRTYQRKVESALNQAILEPTSDNLKRYATIYFETLARAQQFTDRYQLMILQNPQFDYSLRFPVNDEANRIHQVHQQRTQHQQIKAFAKNYGLLFFFSGQCPYCHAFAPILKAFARQYGLTVMAISVDGGSMKEFPKAIVNQQAGAIFNVQHLPALLAVEPKTKSVIALSHGAISFSQLEDNIVRVVQALRNRDIVHE